MAEPTQETADNASAPVEEIRQDMVDTAIKFLTNPKVVNSPISRKTAFLENKGLNAGEIQKAMEAVAGGGPATTAATTAQSSTAVVPQTAPASWKDYFIGTVVAASATYGVALAMKNYVIPRLGLFGGGETQQMLEDLNTSVADLQSDVAAKTTAIKESVDASNEAATEQLHNIMRRVVSLESVPNHSQAISEIKSELGSIKSLLLNRRQFAAPSPQAIAPPSIPAWQRTSVATPATPSTPPPATPTSAVAVSHPVQPPPTLVVPPPHDAATGPVDATPAGTDVAANTEHSSTTDENSVTIDEPQEEAVATPPAAAEDSGSSAATPKVSIAADKETDAPGVVKPPTVTYAQATSTPKRTPPRADPGATAHAQ
eukprot:m.474699 g.474699  ORF g.474699 m.474699 type:complete len:372 (+) comp21679_c0_seq3:113-1228(+)